MKKKIIICSSLLSAIAIAVIAQVSVLSCYKCSGTGKVKIKVTCPTCDGQKKDKFGDNCYRCDGYGYIYEFTECPKCGGSGEQNGPVDFPEPRSRY